MPATLSAVTLTAPRARVVVRKVSATPQAPPGCSQATAKAAGQPPSLPAGDLGPWRGVAQRPVHQLVGSRAAIVRPRFAARRRLLDRAVNRSSHRHVRHPRRTVQASPCRGFPCPEKSQPRGKPWLPTLAPVTDRRFAHHAAPHGGDDVLVLLPRPHKIADHRRQVVLLESHGSALSLPGSVRGALLRCSSRSCGKSGGGCACCSRAAFCSRSFRTRASIRRATINKSAGS